MSCSINGDNGTANLSPDDSSPPAEERPVSGTEHSWCRAVLGGTGITVLALLFSGSPNYPLLQNALHKLQNSHPILRSSLRFHPSSNAFSFLTPSSAPAPPPLQIHPFDLPPSTAHDQGSPIHAILEHELNRNAWSDEGLPPPSDAAVMCATAYDAGEGGWAAVLRLHTGACDRKAAEELLGELVVLMGGGGGGGGGGGAEEEIECEGEVSLGIEDLIPPGKADKPFWARGVNVLGYSLNSLRLSNLSFHNVGLPRRSEVVRLQLDPHTTRRILEGCETRGIKLCGALAAAGLIAARSSKRFPDDRWEKYAVVTLMDCRSILHPPLSPRQLGFYHSAIQNTHDLKGGETLWEVAARAYSSFEDAKQRNKHFSDMADLNFLMCKAIENPGLTPSSSLRTCLISVFEEPVIDGGCDDPVRQKAGVEDYMGCASVHGVGPSIAVFDTIRGGRLDCACVYPAPLHSREQMEALVDEMKRLLASY